MSESPNKLVRDLIPQILSGFGKRCCTETLSDENFLSMVDLKLDEEVAEYHESGNLEELADILEVVYAAAAARGYTAQELDALRERKKKERGAFDKRVLLKTINEEDN